MSNSFQNIPDWFSWENQGAGIAIADTNGNGTSDLIVFMVDNPPGQNQALYRIGRDLDANGNVTGWSTWFGVPGWFSWENQGAGIAAATIGGKLQLVSLMVDNPAGQNEGLYTLLPLVEDPKTQGSWQLLPYTSQVLAIHAAVLRTGKVLFFSGSGNSQVRAASPDWGDMNKGIWTSVVWDPNGSPNGDFFHPKTLRDAHNKPFDFFCGGDTFLPDGTLLSAGGNLAYPAGGLGNLGRKDVAALDVKTEQWSHRASMAHGRWYPTLLPLGDGRVLAVSGLDEVHGVLNHEIEVYDAATDTWHQLAIPGGFGLPLYAHLFLMADGRVFFSGGRMDDGSPQGPCILDLTAHPIQVTPIFGLDDPATRNQSASVLLPPAQDQRVMIIGGGPIDASNATGSTAIVDLKNPKHLYQPASPMSLPRMHLNAVLLPDHTVFVSGGALKREAHTVARLQSEIYDPVTDTWKVAASATVARLYHSVALLLPDGQVVTASGNPPPYGHHVPWEPPDPNEELHLEIYSPPYLFAGPRPQISNAPAQATYGEQITIGTPEAQSIKWASLVRNGVTTHAFDNSQRIVDLDITGRNNTKRSDGGANHTAQTAQAKHVWSGKI